MGKRAPKERKIGMYKAILELKDLEECCNFFEDICAVTELRSMEQRFQAGEGLYGDYAEDQRQLSDDQPGESYDELRYGMSWRSSGQAAR